jgi:hypothetical protein
MSAEWEREENVLCVVCPDCAFTFNADHTDTGGGYSCPCCFEHAARNPAVTERPAEAELAGAAHVRATLIAEADACRERMEAAEADRDRLQASLTNCGRERAEAQIDRDRYREALEWERDTHPTSHGDGCECPVCAALATPDTPPDA